MKKRLLLLIPITICIVIWFSDSILKNNLLFDVDHLFEWRFFETTQLYLYLHLFIVIPVLLLSFDRKVAYYKKWKYLLLPVLTVGLFFIFWDVIFTERGVWGFNEKYLTGMAIAGLPVEELLFFVTVPFACVFIHECTLAYFKRDIFSRLEKVLTPLFIILLFFGAIWKWGHIYTSTTFLLTGVLLLYHWYFLPQINRSRFYLTYLISCVPFILVNGVLTGGFTQEPIVLYNPAEYFGLRFISIPLDDFVYSFLLLFSVIIFYESLKVKSRIIESPEGILSK